jgi:LPS sulfotransferase NodH
MSYRFCIISSPRSASTFVCQSIVGELRSKFFNDLTIDFGEFYNPVYQTFIVKGQYIPANTVVSEITTQARQKFISSSINQLHYNNNIHCVMKILPKLSLVFSNDYQHQLKILESLNFKFLLVHRNNFFDKILSFVVAKTTNIWHRRFIHGQQLYTEAKSTIPIGPPAQIVVDQNEFINCYHQIAEYDRCCDLYKNVVDVTILDYDNLESNAINNNIPFKSSKKLLKTYDRKYIDFVSNYQELLRLFEDLKNG